MISMNQAERDIQRKLRILKHAEETGHIARTCRYFGVLPVEGGASEAR